MARKPNAVPPKPVVDDADADEDKNTPDVVADDDDALAAAGADTTDAGGGQSLEEQLAAAQRRADLAEAEAARLRTESTTVKDDLDTTNLRVIENAMAKEEGNKREAIVAIRAAKEAGDYDAEIEAIDKLQGANLNLKTLGLGKDDLANRIEEKKAAPTDPLDRYVAKMNPTAAGWVRKHFDSTSITSDAPKLERSHYKALGEGLTPNTPDYFDFIEREMGFKEQAPARQQRQADDPPPRRQQPAPAAPVSRSNGDGSGSVDLPAGVTQLSDGRYRLSPTLREYARIAGQTDGEYLNNLLALKKEGRLMH